jgi:hypothetical protein
VGGDGNGTPPRPIGSRRDRAWETAVDTLRAVWQYRRQQHVALTVLRALLDAAKAGRA